MKQIIDNIEAFVLTGPDESDRTGKSFYRSNSK